MVLPFLSQNTEPRQSDAGTHTLNRHIPQDSQMKALQITELVGGINLMSFWWCAEAHRDLRGKREVKRKVYLLTPHRSGLPPASSLVLGQALYGPDSRVTESTGFSIFCAPSPTLTLLNYVTLDKTLLLVDFLTYLLRAWNELTHEGPKSRTFSVLLLSGHHLPITCLPTF